MEGNGEVKVTLDSLALHMASDQLSSLSINGTSQDDSKDELVVSRILEIERLKEKLKSFDFYFNWTSPTLLSIGIVQKTFKALRNRFKEKITATKDISLPFRAFKSIADLATLAFLSIQLGDFDQAWDFLNAALEYIEFSCNEGHLNSEHAAGMKYVLKGLGFWLQSVGQEIIGPNDAFFLNLDEVEDPTLSDKSKAAVLGMKCCFYGKLQKFTLIDLKIQILEKMIQLDPDHFEWHLILYHALRYIRRESVDKYNGPKERELKAFNAAFSINPNHRQCLLAQCLCVADLHRSTPWFHSSKQATSHPLKLGSLTLNNSKGVIDFYKRRERVILSGCDEVNPNLTFARIYGAFLPRRMREYETSRAILNKALKANPKSAKVENSLGFLYITQSNKDIESSKTHFLNAIALDPHHYEALAQLLYLFLNDPVKNEKDFKRLFGNSINDDSMEANVKSTFYFIFGLLHFALGRLREAMEAWSSDPFLLSPPNYKPILSFDRLDILAHHFQFPRNKKGCKNLLNISSIISAPFIQSIQSWDLDEETKKKYMKVHHSIAIVRQYQPMNVRAAEAESNNWRVDRNQSKRNSGHENLKSWRE